MTDATHPPRLLTTVFVYGTLMPGERNDHVARQGGAFTVRPATLRGFRLLHLRPEAYPGIVPAGPEQVVRGHALTYAPHDWPRALPFLDALEGTDDTPPLYTREQVVLTVEDAPEIPAWVYIYARADRLARPGVEPVPSGDWRDAAERRLPPGGDR
ncbi:gamma-glutamylcyclotransferase family protein [Deinococcus koreensis]|uniref:Putative gamma-glutamylcyclotransferase n=1 Tax=Deinococcus koreensis TaxID=2054903 RepID=A0A2K3UZS9_9DEIO|nr:gamma-glutamylcyclotransferase family protein [Deinococcus koreensis]PNY82040.1 hypothetical protein CVO96_12265 [Deinococcus koreensis]